MNQYKPLPPPNPGSPPNTASWQECVQNAKENWRSFLARSNSNHDQSATGVAMLLGLGHAEALVALVELWHETQGSPVSIAAQHSAISPKTPRETHLLVLEPNPVTYEALSTIANELPENQTLCLKELLQAWPMRAPGWHQLELLKGQLVVSMHFGEVLAGLRSCQARVSLILGHGQLIDSPPLIHAIARQCQTGALWFAADLAEDLAKVANHAGFEAADGAASTVLQYTGGPKPKIQLADSGSRQIKHVAVVGAGIAGSSVALRLCKSGIKVTLFDAADQPAAGASGNWVGAFHPHFSRDDAPLSQLTRLGCEHTLAALKALSAEGLLKKGKDWDIPGHLQTVPEDELEKTQESVKWLQPDKSWLEWRARGECFEGSPAGLWFPGGGWVRPAHWVNANLKACGSLLELKLGQRLKSLPEGFDAIVVACAESSLALASAPGLSANQVKGQVSLYARQRPLPCVLSGHSYAIDCQDDWILLGATYERPVRDLTPTAEADQLNLDRFEQSYPDWPVGELLDHRCSVRSVWPDRLPAIGAVGKRDDVLLCTGFASRGLSWAAMASWQINQILLHGQARSVKLNLLEKLAPNRYYKPPQS